jgi:hypothetical protein
MLITQCTTLKMVVAQLTFICRMWQKVCCCWFGISRLLVSYLWMIATNYHLDNPRCQAKYCWHSVDAYFQNGAVTVSLAILPIRVANTTVVLYSNKLLYNYLVYKTKNCWQSIDVQFQTEAGSVQLLFLKVKVVNTLFIDVCNQCRLK